MKKYFIFGLMATLAACSSDKGDGLNDGYLNYRNRGIPENNNRITTMDTTSQNSRTAYLTSVLGGEYIATTTNNKNQFDNLYNYLVMGKVDGADDTALKNAVFVACGVGGADCGNKLPGNDEDIKTWVSENKDMLATAAQKQYKEYGLFLGDADFTLSNDSVGKNMVLGLSGKVITTVDFAESDTKTVRYIRSDNSGLFRKIDDGATGVYLGTSTLDAEKLSYSGFGSIKQGTINSTGRIDNAGAKYTTYYGGYDTLKVENPTIEEGAEFSGRATGFVHGRNGDVKPIDGTARLTFNNDSHGELDAYFVNWYDVNIKSDGVISFNNYKPQTEDNNYKFTESEETRQADVFNTVYYGIAGSPTEAVGGFKYHEDGNPDNSNDAGVSVDAAFGVKKK